MGSRPLTILTQSISFHEDAIRDKDNEMKSAYATLIFLTKHTLWSFSNQVTQVLAFTNFKHFIATFDIGKENISYLRSLYAHTRPFSDARSRFF